MSSFKNFIEEKPLYYKEIDHERVHIAYDKLKPHIKKPTVIHVVGTNGKGSTGRIMATLLHLAGYDVGHFSSPHILKFNERIWLNGEDSSDEILEEAHARLYTILGQEVCAGLSYFEYTTLLSFVVMEELDIIILEAGLGGEFDATNVVDKELSVITPIGIDHQDFLGDSIESIATTKLNSIDKKAIVGFQQSDEVERIALKISQERGTELYFLRDVLNSLESETFSQRVQSTRVPNKTRLKPLVKKDLESKILSLTEEMGWSGYLYENTLLAMSALDVLDLNYDIESLREVKLFGRFYQFLPNVIIDVGHNLLASEAIVRTLKAKNQKVVLIYNTLDDKDYLAILKSLAPVIEWVEVLPIETARAVDIEILHQNLKKLSLTYKKFNSIKDENSYLVFGSFYVVEAFIKKN